MAFNESQALDDMKKNFVEITDCEKDLQIDVIKLHEVYDAKRNEIYDKRQKLIEDIQARASKSFDDGGELPALNNFWSKVLRYACEDFDNNDDEAILFFLKDMRHKTTCGDGDSNAQMVLEFYFDKNPFFANDLLTKHYFINDTVDPHKITGCEIKWCDGENEKISTPFLNFFSPPEMLPSTDICYFKVLRILNHDLEVGFFLKEEVIPGAVNFFLNDGPRMKKFSLSEYALNQSDSDTLSDTTSNSATPPETTSEDNSDNESSVADSSDDEDPGNLEDEDESVESTDSDEIQIEN